MLVITFLVTALLPAAAHAGTVARSCPQPATGPESVKSLIRCAAPKLGLSTSKALQVAWRESRYHPGARNNSSGTCGVFQHMPRYWPERVRRWYWGTDPSCYDGRTNVLVSLRMVRSGGWSPWGT
jgi:hypothetical protein